MPPSVPQSQAINARQRTALGKLPAIKQRYVKARAEGVSAPQAALSVGRNATAGRRWDREEDVRAAYRELVRKSIPPQHLVGLIKGGCNATMPVYDASGVVASHRADWRTRRGYIEMASKHGGYYEDKQGQVAPAITFVVNHIGRAAQQLSQGTIDAESDTAG